MKREFNIESVKYCIQRKIIRFEYSYSTGTFVCWIGGSWFYFLNENDDCTIFDFDKLAERIYNIINEPDGRLSEREADHHKWFIMDR